MVGFDAGCRKGYVALEANERYVGLDMEVNTFTLFLLYIRFRNILDLLLHDCIVDFFRCVVNIKKKK